jgi:Methyltransferase domain
MWGRQPGGEGCCPSLLGGILLIRRSVPATKSRDTLVCNKAPPANHPHHVVRLGRSVDEWRHFFSHSVKGWHYGSITRYDQIGNGYSTNRRTDPDIAERISTALGTSLSVLNVGAGTGSYETCASQTIAVEPSFLMITQRREGSAPVVQAAAERLPFPSDSFDAAMALLTLHHWIDIEAGFGELRRVAGKIVILTFDPDVHGSFWLFNDYLPEAMELASAQPAPPAAIARLLETDHIEAVPISSTCADGFTVAYWRRPEAYLNPEVRACCSSFAELPLDIVESRMRALAGDLQSGRWHAKYGALEGMDYFDAGLRLIVA